MMEAITDAATAVAKRAMETIMTIKKIDIARIEAARRERNRLACS